MAIGVAGRSHVQRLLLLGAALLVVGLLVAYSAPAAAADRGLDGGSAARANAIEVSAAPAPAGPRTQGAAEDEDPFHVSDNELAVAILLPGFFLVLTAAVIGWAWSARVKRDD